MATLTAAHTVDDAGLAALLEPRDDIVAERRIDDANFGLAHGPFTRYHRSITVEGLDDGHHRVTEHYDFRAAVLVWSVLYTPLVRRALRSRRLARSQPWWAPPDRLDATTTRTIALLAMLMVVTGYIGTLMSQTITFATDEFDADKTAQGVTLAAVRIGNLLTLAVAVLADRRGRRPLVLTATFGACILAGVGSIAPGLWSLGSSQAAARGLAAAMSLLIGIMAAEAAPRNSRAYLASVLTLSAGFGSFLAVAALPLADLGERGWRLVYAIALLGLPVAVYVRRHLPESHRFVEASGVGRPERVSLRSSRFTLLAATGFLTALFVAPASQFANEFLRDERGFSAGQISLFTITSNTLVIVGLAVGGRLADSRGRKGVAGLALMAGAVLVVARYAQSGVWMWTWSVLGSFVAAMAVPALSVYGAELFGTGDRGRANGWMTVIAVTGSAIGLLAVGFMSDAFGSFAPAFAIVLIGPLVVGILVLTRFPETAHLELEDLNPQDAARRHRPAG